MTKIIFRHDARHGAGGRFCRHLLYQNKTIMATLKAIDQVSWTAEHHTENNFNLWTKFIAWTDSQKPNHTLWFFITLIGQGVLFLPVPAVLMYYYDAPIGVLAVTMVCFFTTIIANMGGEGIRTTLTLLAASTIIHVAMVLAFVF
ncbi:hypothetical protein [Mucilaginibacter agri]|uniref:Uncharacterized protein n=1 Tax=Mucilaginibacter agri TaxID=2695265 RepID=A0A966DSE5_9SPHI|nr:hypothetical protein [Mucilaginibacter agri]NCD68246.1 hypothetical protein [Mucilaginibacter agri]